MFISQDVTANPVAFYMGNTHRETHTGMLKSWEHLLIYSQIELAITESKKQNKTSGAVSSRGYKSEG